MNIFNNNFMDSIIYNINSFYKFIDKVGGEKKLIVYERPATENEILSIEKEINIKIPSELRDIFLNISSKFECGWQIENEDIFDDEKFSRRIFKGELSWNLFDLPQLYETYIGWINDCYNDPENEYDKVYYNKFPIYEVPNGDLLAIDLDEDTYGKIIYLSHDDGEGHGYVMADTIIDLLKKWSILGFVGAEDWQWILFTNDSESGINITSKNSKEFLEIVHLITSK